MTKEIKSTEAYYIACLFSKHIWWWIDNITTHYFPRVKWCMSTPLVPPFIIKLLDLKATAVYYMYYCICMELACLPKQANQSTLYTIQQLRSPLWSWSSEKCVETIDFHVCSDPSHRVSEQSIRFNSMNHTLFSPNY